MLSARVPCALLLQLLLDKDAPKIRPVVGFILSRTAMCSSPARSGDDPALIPKSLDPVVTAISSNSTSAQKQNRSAGPLLATEMKGGYNSCR
jgi:hypothetical protein